MKNFERYIGMLANILDSSGYLSSVLKKLPYWMLVGLALSGIIFLFILPEDFKYFRILIKMLSVLFSCLSVTKIIMQLIEYYLKDRKMKKDNQRLKLFFYENECRWILTKQQDGSYVSQISLKIGIHNLSDSPISLVKTRLIRPKTKARVLHAKTLLPEVGNLYDIYDSRNKAPPRDTVKALSDIFVAGTLACQGKDLCLTIGITDQFGEEHQVKGIITPASEQSMTKINFYKILSAKLSKPIQRHLNKIRGTLGATMDFIKNKSL